MVNAGIKPTATYSYLAEEAGGVDVLGYSKKDCFNFIHQLIKSKVEAGDAQSVVNEFNNRQANETLFYWDVQLDLEGRIANFFWRDGRSRIDYEIFGDVVSFDTTYRTNKYRMICAPFIGINHHWQNIIFGCAFLSDESAESFKWLFSTFLKSMGGIAPKTIITDQVQAMAIAIREVMSGTRHRLCQWHISQNAPSHLGSLKNDKGFSKLFNKCMSECDSITEFDKTWEMMLTMHNVEEHKWLKNLYNIRHMWSTAFNNDVFSAGLKATSRSESTNHVLNGFGDLSTYLHIFVTNYEKNVVNKWCLSEEHEDFKCKQ
uniref:Protein FAR1-RELATED SEQUENCE 5-like n=1 Tax=Nicotiana tabacum TaxID=4097 RepID=A0A1S3Y580_TOBAC